MRQVFGATPSTGPNPEGALGLRLGACLDAQIFAADPKLQVVSRSRGAAVICGSTPILPRTGVPHILALSPSVLSVTQRQCWQVSVVPNESGLRTGQRTLGVIDPGGQLWHPTIRLERAPPLEERSGQRSEMRCCAIVSGDRSNIACNRVGFARRIAASAFCAADVGSRPGLPISEGLEERFSLGR
jgi:hypothetical protein